MSGVAAGAAAAAAAADPAAAAAAAGPDVAADGCSSIVCVDQGVIKA
jgi:hypothetical protein